MTVYSFTVQVTGINVSEDGFQDALFEAGCADALPVVVDGTLFLDFDREAPSYNSAISSAKRDIEHAGGRVLQIERSGD